MTNYDRPAFSGSLWKPTRGAAVLAKEKADAKAKDVELEVKAAVKARDKGCRWPERHKCRKGLEAAHIQDASTLLDPTMPARIGARRPTTDAAGGRSWRPRCSWRTSTWRP